MIHLLRTTAEHPDFHALVGLLDEDLARRDGAEHAFYAVFNSSASLPHVVLAYRQEVPVGCGAFKAFAPDLVEIKRMFVQPSNRERGVATSILRELEGWAQELHYTGCVLETGKRQPEAISLYQKSGYGLIANYGQYVGIDNSVCLQKFFVGTPATRRN